MDYKELMNQNIAFIEFLLQSKIQSFQNFGKEAMQKKNDIALILKKYNYSIPESDMFYLGILGLLYDVQTFFPQETIINNLKLILFLQQNESCFVCSTQKKEKIQIPFTQQINICSYLQKEVEEQICIFFKEHFPDIPLKDFSEYTLSDWLIFFRKIPIPTTKEHQISEIYYIKTIYNIAINNQLFALQKNSKGTFSITNKEASFIYDLLQYIKTGVFDKSSEISNKEKSDYIRYRLKQMGKNSGK